MNNIYVLDEEAIFEWSGDTINSASLLKLKLKQFSVNNIQVKINKLLIPIWQFFIQLSNDYYKYNKS